MRPGEWSSEEVETLIALYPTHTPAELTKILDRSYSSLNSKASKLGLKKNANTVSRTMSTRYDKELAEFNELSVDDVPLSLAFKHRDWLYTHYYDKELSLPDIAEITGTTRKNVEYWMNKFGLERRDEKERYTSRCLTKISETGKGRVPFSKGLTKYDHPSIMKISEKVRGENAGSWNGGVHMQSSGYRMVTKKDHPKANKDGYVLEHRLVVERVLGRYLLPKEIVHHRDHDRQNNAEENLFLFPNASAHSSFHNYKKWVNPDITEEAFMEEVYSNENSN